MPNGTNLLTEAEFENEIEKMTDRQLGEFTARQIMKVTARCMAEATEFEKLSGRIKAVEDHDRKSFVVTGTAGGSVGAAIAVLVNYILGSITGH